MTIRDDENSSMLPIEVNGLKLESKCFYFDSVKYFYKDIIGVLYTVVYGSYNFVPYTTVKLQLRLSDHQKIKLKLNKNLFNKKKIPILMNCGEILKNGTVKNRGNYYVNKLITDGYIDYKFNSGNIRIPSTVRIYANGIIEKGNTKINIKKAKESGVLLYGTTLEGLVSWKFHHTNPNEIAISENKDALYITALRINAEWDNDIIFWLFEQFSRGVVFT